MNFAGGRASRLVVTILVKSTGSFGASLVFLDGTTYFASIFFFSAFFGISCFYGATTACFSIFFKSLELALASRFFGDDLGSGTLFAGACFFSFS